MTDQQKIKLIKRIHDEAYAAFESFNEDRIGTGLAYLYANIAYDLQYRFSEAFEDSVFENWLQAVVQTSWGRPLKKFVSFAKENQE